MKARWLLAGVAATLTLGAVSSLPASGAGARQGATVRAAQTDLSATIRRTENGIPHIESSTFAGAGYGYGYAFAQDNLCVMAEDYVTVDGQRSRYFGPDKSYMQRGNGISANNLNSDFFFQQIIDNHTVESLLDQQPPNGPRQELRDLIRGSAPGYTRSRGGVGGPDGVPDRSCRGKPWVHPI